MDVTDSSKVKESQMKLKLSQKHLSPVNIEESIARPKYFPPLILNGHWLNDGEATLQNDGLKPRVFLAGDRIPSTIKGGPLLKDEFEFYEAHFHWGVDNCDGSDHTVNGTWYSMEAHIVHWNRKYITFKDSLKYKDGLCILCYLFLVTISPWNHPLFEKITENLEKVEEPKTETKVPANCLAWMREATQSHGYYTYEGSYSKSEGATWIVFPKTILIRPCQVEAFRRIKDLDGRPILTNKRPTQHLWNRKVYRAIDC